MQWGNQRIKAGARWGLSDCFSQRNVMILNRIMTLRISLAVLLRPQIFCRRNTFLFTLGIYGVLPMVMGYAVGSVEFAFPQSTMEPM